MFALWNAFANPLEHLDEVSYKHATTMCLSLAIRVQCWDIWFIFNRASMYVCVCVFFGLTRIYFCDFVYWFWVLRIFVSQIFCDRHAILYNSWMVGSRHCCCEATLILYVLTTHTYDLVLVIRISTHMYYMHTWIGTVNKKIIIFSKQNCYHANKANKRNSQNIYAFLILTQCI